MKLNYFPDTDSLYIDFAQRPSVESREVSDGVVLDYDGEWSDWGERHGRKSRAGSGRAMREAAEIQMTSPMSLTAILAEIPKLSFSERQELVRRTIELEDEEITPEEKVILEERLADFRRNPNTGLPTTE